MSKLRLLFLVLISLQFTTLFAGDSLSTELEKFDQKIMGELQAKDAEAANLFQKANALRDARKYAEAAALYQQVHERQPGFVHAVRRQGFCELMQGHRDAAISLCRSALTAEKSTENLSALAMALASDVNKKPAPHSDLVEAGGLMNQALDLGNPTPDTLMTACEVAVQANDIGLLQKASLALDVRAPEEVATHYYAVLLALSEGRLSDARQRLEKAHALKLDDHAYQALSRAIDESEPWIYRIGRKAAVVVGLWLCGMFVLLLLGWILSRAMLHTAQKLGQIPASAPVPSGGLRKLYAAVLWLCSGYYYLSLPLVILIVLGSGAGLIYAIFATGHVPIKLIAIIAVIVLVSIKAVFKSIFVRMKDTDPGMKLSVAEHPKFQNVLKEVASQIHTPVVDNVYLTPGVDVAVMERAGLLKNLNGHSERCLILGAGVLEGMKVREFKAILAHEYGHLVNRDTAGGGFALAVRRSILTMARHLASQGAAAWYNPAWLFVIGFYRIFLRISQGASRLQEVLADRWAVIAYGSDPFIRGLKHVVERGCRFDVHVNSTLKEVVEGARPLANLYRYQPQEALKEEEITAEIQKQMNGEASAYDSHPRPADRFALAAALHAAGMPAGIDDNEEAWSLFADPEALEKQMTAEVRENIQQRHGITIPAPA